MPDAMRKIRREKKNTNQGGQSCRSVLNSHVAEIWAEQQLRPTGRVGEERQLRPATVTIHPSQFPNAVRRDLLVSLRTRQVNHKFHYDSIKQTQKWLALHEAYSPARTDVNCVAIYDESFLGAIKHIETRRVHLIGLGCGGGQKDAGLLQCLKEQGTEAFYTPSDVSVAMVLVAQQMASSVIAPEKCFPFVCDLASSSKIDFPRVIPKDAARLVTFFGMIPNFEPQIILPKLAALLRVKDWLLFSANLAPGKNYAAGVRKILPLYDNALTRDWLQTFLVDLGVEKSHEQLEFVIEDCPARTKLKRIAAYFVFSKRCVIELPEERFAFQRGEKIRLFFSYRHTPEHIRSLLAENEISVVAQWVAKSQEEGVFLCRKST